MMIYDHKHHRMSDRSNMLIITVYMCPNDRFILCITETVGTVAQGRI